jgi:hypothetical protein
MKADGASCEKHTCDAVRSNDRMPVHVEAIAAAVQFHPEQNPLAFEDKGIRRRSGMSSGDARGQTNGRQDD